MLGENPEPLTWMVWPSVSPDVALTVIFGAADALGAQTTDRASSPRVASRAHAVRRAPPARRPVPAPTSVLLMNPPGT